MLKIQNQDDLRIVKNTLCNNSSNFSVEKKGNKSAIYMNGKRKAVFYKTQSTMGVYFDSFAKLGVIRTVHRQADDYIYKKKKMAILPVKPIHPPTFRDIKAFADLPIGTKLVSVDIKHAYWRVAYNMGVINKDTYKKYADDKELKLARNIALSTLNSALERDLYFKGLLRSKIECYDPWRKLVYNNIRQKTYNIIGEIAEMLDMNCFSYRIDGLLTLDDPDIIDSCSHFFRKRKVLFTVERFTKHSQTHLQNNDSGELKKF